MSLIRALVQELLKIFVGGPKRPPRWNRVNLAFRQHKLHNIFIFGMAYCKILTGKYPERSFDSRAK